MLIGLGVAMVKAWGMSYNQLEGDFPLLQCEAPVMVKETFESQMMSKLIHVLQWGGMAS